jgi:hypothetical protein
MTRKVLFDIVTIGRYVLPICLALGLVALSRPKSPVLRSAIGVVAAWVVAVQLVMGWLLPALAVAAFFVARRIWVRRVPEQPQ